MSSSFLHTRTFSVALLVLGCLGFAAAWILMATWLQRACSWMAVLAALDAALLLRITRFPAGRTRMLLTVGATATMIALACWGLAAARIGGPLGLLPWESMLKMGTGFGWLLVQLGTTTADLAWFGAALLVAALASR